MAAPVAPSRPKLSEAARHLVYPTTIRSSVFPDVEERLSEVGIEFDPWQQGFGMIALGLDSNGHFAATVGGVTASIPRQVGKTFTVGYLLIGLCLLIPGLRVIWTSHHLRTTGNTFRSMQGMVRRRKIMPHIEAVRLVNGEQEILFRNGSTIMFGARALGFGRGMDAIDIEVFDEAQILPLRALEDMVPATNQARNPHGGLLFFIGTPPRPAIDDGESFSAKRQQALDGNRDDDAVYVEFSADPAADLDDELQWPVMNPSYPSRTPRASMLRMRKNMPDEDAWRREAMGIWPVAGEGSAIPPEVWRAARRATADLTDVIALGVYTNLPRTRSAIAVATRCVDGTVLVEVVPAERDGAATTLPGTAWIAPRVQQIVEDHSPCATVLDGRSAAASLLPDFEALGVEITTTGAQDVARACGQFYDLLTEGKLRHLGAVELDDAALSAKWRDLADSRAWDRKDKTSDITQLVAVTLALHGLITHGGENKEVEPWGFFE